MNDLEEVEKAYIAGMIDGEGCISVIPSGKTIAQTIYVANTNIDLIFWLYETTGIGSIADCGRGRGYSDNWKPVYKWIMWADDIREFLPEILPYLVIKQEQAKLMLESLAIIGSRWHPLSVEQKTHRAEIIAKMRLLNARGVHASI